MESHTKEFDPIKYTEQLFVEKNISKDSNYNIIELFDEYCFDFVNSYFDIDFKMFGYKKYNSFNEFKEYYFDEKKQFINLLRNNINYINLSIVKNSFNINCSEIRVERIYNLLNILLDKFKQYDDELKLNYKEKEFINELKNDILKIKEDSQYISEISKQIENQSNVDFFEGKNINTLQISNDIKNNILDIEKTDSIKYISERGSDAVNEQERVFRRGGVADVDEALNSEVEDARVWMICGVADEANLKNSEDDEGIERVCAICNFKSYNYLSYYCHNITCK